MPTNQTASLLLIKKSFRNLKLDSQKQSCWLLNFLRCLNYSHCQIKRQQDQLSLLAGRLASMCLTRVLKGFDGRKPFVSSEFYGPGCGKPFEFNDTRGQRLERIEGLLFSK